MRTTLGLLILRGKIYGEIKISQVFVTGVKEITTTPALFGDVLEYEGKFYKIL